MDEVGAAAEEKTVGLWRSRGLEQGFRYVRDALPVVSPITFTTTRFFRWPSNSA
jgi:hypothetical protein